ncbi:MAG: FAD-binding oxidoreductase [Pseudomonadota bacterium]
MSAPADIAIVGGGLVGLSLATGFVRRGARVVILDPDEDDLHASAGNFGLVWVQGKGMGAPAYSTLTRRSAQGWDAFAQNLEEESGLKPAYRRSGGLKIALNEDELDAQRTALQRMHNQDSAAGVRLIDRNALRELVPAVGPEAVGATFCEHDGHADPLTTHAALRTVLMKSQNVTVRRARAHGVRAVRGGFEIDDDLGTVAAGRVVLAAGLGNAELGRALGLHAPLRPQRGQILVTARMPHFLEMACHTVRQTEAGSVMIGDSKEDVGFDRGVTQPVAAAMAARAVRLFPVLRTARVVRQWGALRVMSPDGLPVYAQAPDHPGATLISCHSGVTLAAAHAGEVADAILDGTLSRDYAAFAPDRFQAAA